VAFQLIPRAPTIVVAPGFPEAAQQEAISFSVSVQSDVFDQNESVEVSLQHLHGEQTVGVQKWLAKDSNPIPRQVTLRPGQNVLTMTARHVNATQESRILEESKRSFVIRLSEPQRPEIQLAGVVAKVGREPVAINPGVPWETALRSIDIQGKISVNPPDKLMQASYSIASGPEVALTGFKADSRFQFTQTIPFSQTGRQTVTISTTSNRGINDRVSFDVFFKPALPELSQLSLASGELAIPADRVIIEGRDDPEITVNAKFVPPTSDSLFPHLARIVLRQKSGESMDEKAIEFSAGDQKAIREQIRLQRGENQIELFIQNEWGKKSLLSEALIYRQPPRIVRTELPKNSKTPVAQFEAEIASVLPLTGVRVFRNGFDFEPEKVAIINIPQKADLWSVSFSVPLELDGKRTNVDFGVENADGECLRRVSSDSTYIQPPPPIADIRPAFGKMISTKDPNLNIHFRVRSESPLQEVRINFKGNSTRSTTIPIDDLPKPGLDGYFTLSHSMSLEQLDERTFKFFVEVKNAGGISRTKTTEVNYLPEPIPLVVDELRPAGGTPLRPVGFRTLRFPAVDVAKLELKGHLEAFKPRPDSEASKEIRVKIWVNGFLQTSVPVEDHGEFSAKIVLNLENANRISFEVPSEAIDEVCLPKLVIDCKAHQSPANLRLITAIATDEKRVKNPDDSAQKLQDRILATMQIENSLIKGFKVALTKILEGDEFTDNSFEGHLRLMKGMMNRLDDEPTNDVILIYYQGKEIRSENGDFELTTGIPDMNVKRRKLVSLLSDIPGAHLLLLDVERTNLGDREQTWTDRHLGLLRVAWARQPNENTGSLRLVDALEKNVSQTIVSQKKQLVLANIATMLERTYQEFRNKSPSVHFTSKIPEDLERLVLTP
jgi:hypothetical protein